MTLGQQCKHGQLARQCELCERDATIAELRSKVRELEADAERYRKWRTAYTSEDDPLLGVLVDTWTPDAVDAAIDAARQGGSNG